MPSYYSGTKVPAENVAHWLYQAGVRGDDLWKLTGIARRESGYDTGAHRTDSPRERLSGDLGLFQINYSNVQRLQQAGVIGSRQDLFDPVKNTQAAVWLYKRGGLTPWALGSNGWSANGDPMRGVKVEDARAATSRYLANPQAYASGWGSNSAPQQDTQPNWDERLDSSVATTSSTEPRDTGPAPVTPEQQALTSMLERYGINYDNAPEATPALLAFMRGMGMSLDTAEDTRRQNDLCIRQPANMSREDLARQDERTRESITTDVQRRGVLSSGETNTRFARQAEDRAAREARIAQTSAEGLERNEQGYNTLRDQLGQQALEKTLGVETSQAVQSASARAQEEAIRARQRESDLAWERQKALMEQQRRQTANQFRDLNVGY